MVASLPDGRRLVDNVRTKDLGYTEKVRTDAVLVPVIVTDGGQFVRGLKQQDFQIYEDGVPQPIASMVSEDAPLDLVLAIDISGSMERSLPQVKAAVKQFLTKLRSNDAVSLVGFNDTMFIVAERERDRQTREAAVELLTSWGGTALYDATIRSLDLVSRDWGRKGVVIFSDGDDRNSLSTREKAMSRVQASDAMLYTIGFGAGAEVPQLKKSLESYARSTGGRAFFPRQYGRARRHLRADRVRAGQSVRALVCVDQREAGQHVAQHQGPGAQAAGTTFVPAAATARRDRSAPRGDPCRSQPQAAWRRRRWRCCLSAVDSPCPASSSSSTPPPPPPPAEQLPAFRSGVELVTIDVGVVDRQGLPVRGLAPTDFTVTVASETRRVVTAEFVELGGTQSDPRTLREASVISSNEGGGVGRLVVFVVDQNTLEAGSFRYVATASSRFFDRLSFADRSALVLIPVGQNIGFTWAHDRVKEALLHVTGWLGPPPTGNTAALPKRAISRIAT